MTEKERERLRQIREQRAQEYGHSFTGTRGTDAMMGDIDFLLSLCNSQVVERSVFPLPEWADCQSMFADGTQTPLSEFIRAYEPIQSTSPDDKTADQWRQDLAAVIDHVATAMRSACVEKVRKMRDEVELLIGRSTRHSNTRRRASI